MKKFPRPVALHFLGRKTWNFDIGLMYHEREKFSAASEIHYDVGVDASGEEC